MISHHEKRVVPFAADLMYSIVADVEQYPKFLPWVVALRVLSRRTDGLTAEMAVGYGALRERYTSDVRLDPVARTVDVVEIHKGKKASPFKCLENHWRFTPTDEGCEVDFAILFEFKSRLLHGVAGHAFEKVLLKMTDAFEARAAALSHPVS